jgi:hypothetical protein
MLFCKAMGVNRSPNVSLQQNYITVLRQLKCLQCLACWLNELLFSFFTITKIYLGDEYVVNLLNVLLEGNIYNPFYTTLETRIVPINEESGYSI